MRDERKKRLLHLRCAESHVHEPARCLLHDIGSHRRRELALLSSAAHRLLLATVDSLRDVLFAEDLLGRVQVVGSTTSTEVRWLIASTERARMDVIELETRPALATVSFGI